MLYTGLTRRFTLTRSHQVNNQTVLLTIWTNKNEKTVCVKQFNGCDHIALTSVSLSYPVIPFDQYGSHYSTCKPFLLFVWHFLFKQPKSYTTTNTATHDSTKCSAGCKSRRCFDVSNAQISSDVVWWSMWQQPCRTNSHWRFDHACYPTTSVGLSRAQYFAITGRLCDRPKFCDCEYFIEQCRDRVLWADGEIVLSPVWRPKQRSYVQYCGVQGSRLHLEYLQCVFEHSLIVEAKSLTSD